MIAGLKLEPAAIESVLASVHIALFPGVADSTHHSLNKKLISRFFKVCHEGFLRFYTGTGGILGFIRAHVIYYLRLISGTGARVWASGSHSSRVAWACIMAWS